jgi:hypothetical protein
VRGWLTSTGRTQSSLAGELGVGAPIVSQCRQLQWATLQIVALMEHDRLSPPVVSTPSSADAVPLDPSAAAGAPAGAARRVDFSSAVQLREAAAPDGRALATPVKKRARDDKGDDAAAQTGAGRPGRSLFNAGGGVGGGNGSSWARAALISPAAPPRAHSSVVVVSSEWVLQIDPTSQIIFEKKLTQSDTNRLGRMVLHKSHAELHFNRALDGCTGVPVVVTDTHGREWTFKYRSWQNNKSKMHVIDGIQPFISAAGFQTGDTFVFAVSPLGRFHVGGRKGDPPAFATPPRGPTTVSLAH